jgi:hypothetical protein
LPSTISRVLPALKSEIPKWLEQWKFDRFVTLATNDSPARLISSNARLADLLKEWDGRINRKLVGPEWASRVEDRMWAFYFLEKPVSNPHWHGLIRFVPYFPARPQERAELFDLHAERIWKKLVPKGSVEILPIVDQRGVADYVSKELPYPVSYEHYVTPDQF